MLEYLVILIDDISPSFCKGENPAKEPNLIPLETLHKAIIYGMKENLMIHFVLPSYQLPKEYIDMMEMIDHVKIGTDIKIIEDLSQASSEGTVILRTSFKSFIQKIQDICELSCSVERLNICFYDVEDFRDSDIDDYQKALNSLSDGIVFMSQAGKNPHINIITDRIGRSEMGNCGAGISNITIAPNGKFYVCPAFYYDELRGIDNLLNHCNPSSSRSIGDIDKGLSINNQELLRLDHAPLCRICDAYHCHRCIWLNQKLTGDANTPSRQQCIMAHIERNASRRLEQTMNSFDERKVTIPEIDYLDPFELITRK